MKVAILCGGKGTRFYPLSESTPKPLIKIGDMPILEHVMRIYSHYGYNEFILLLGHKGGAILDYFAEKHPKWDIEFKYTGVNTQTGDRIYKARDLLGDSFFLTYSDGLADINLDEELKFHKKHKGIGTVTITPLPSPFGIATFNSNNRITSFMEKPILNDRWINAGFFIFNKEVFDHWEGRDLEKEILPKLSKTKSLYAYNHLGFWKCMDHYKDYTYLNEHWKNGSAKWAVWKKP